MAWHDAYDEPTSALARRLVVVRRRLAEALDAALAASGRPVRLLSLCSGEGRDVIPEVAGRAVTAVLVEQDEELCRRAGAAAGPGVEVRCGDAGDTATWADAVPVDVLVLCGIFGNVEPAAVAGVIAAVPALVVPGGRVLWTRGRRGDVDRRPEVRRWFVDAGLEELAYEGEPEPYGVGLNRLAAPPATPPVLPARLFTFL